MMKKILLFVVLFVFVLGACVAPTSEVEVKSDISVFQKAQNGKPFRHVVDEQIHPYYLTTTAGFLKACEDYGLLCEINGIDELDDARLLAMANAITLDETSGILYTLHVASRYSSAEGLIEKGIPVVSFHTPIPKGDVKGLLAWASPDPTDYSLEAGRAAAEKSECVGPVASSQSGFVDFENVVVDNFEKRFLELCPDVEMLPRIAVGSGDDSVGIAASVAVLQAHPDLSVAFTSTSTGALWWALAAQEVGMEPGKLIIIGMDGTRANLDLVKNGEVWMLVGQPIFEQAYYLVVLLVTDMMGYPVTYENYLPTPQITLENVEQFYEIVDLAEGVRSK